MLLRNRFASTRRVWAGQPFWEELCYGCGLLQLCGIRKPRTRPQTPRLVPSCSPAAARVRFLWPFKLLINDGCGSKIISDFSTEAIEDSSHHLLVAQFQSSGKGKTSEIQKTEEKKTSLWNSFS